MWVNPYQGHSEHNWKKMNLHSHAGTGQGTCGTNPVEAVVELYKQYQFDVLCISNHDLFTDTSALSDEQMLLLPGVEYSRDGHMLTIGVDRSLHELEHQEAINQAQEQGGFVVLCHPHWQRPDYWPVQDMLALRGYLGIEVINMLIYRLTGTGMATDVWDALLSQGRLVYGFGNDDFHLFGDVSRSFTLVNAESNTRPAIRSALDAGRFCASTGVYPRSLRLENDALYAEAFVPSAPDHGRLLYRFIADGGRLIHEQRGCAASCSIEGCRYIRVEAWADNGAVLLFQPVYDFNALNIK